MRFRFRRPRRVEASFQRACVCGHLFVAHQHYRAGTECVAGWGPDDWCKCMKFKAAKR